MGTLLYFKNSFFKLELKLKANQNNPLSRSKHLSFHVNKHVKTWGFPIVIIATNQQVLRHQPVQL